VPPALFTAFRLGGITLPNRVVVSPMAQYTAVEHVPQPWHLQHLGSLAVSGPGLVMIESTTVEPEGYGTEQCLALHNDAQEAGFARLMEDIRSFSSTPFGLQLGHSGRKASTAHPTEGGKPMLVGQGGWQVCGPSPLQYGPSWPMPQELDTAGLARVRQAYVQAAERAARVGIDVLELHAAHGYLLNSFVSATTNRRTDAYGGSLANRMRFPLEVVEAVRAVWPAARAFGLRVNMEDGVAGGSGFDDTLAFCAELKRLGCDYVCVSNGSVSEHSRTPASPGYLVPYAERVRAEVGIATMAVGLIVTPQQAQAVIAEGRADLVALARAFIDDPRWVWRAAQELGAEVAYPFQYERGRPSAWPGARLRWPKHDEATVH